jgi:hypothetical protein
VNITKISEKLTIQATIAAILFFIKMMDPGFSDNDFYWHIKTGEYIVSTLSFPVQDIFSFPYFGKEWILHEWLTEVVLYQVFHIFSFTGIQVLVAVVSVCTFLVLCRLSRKLIGNETTAVLVTLLFFVPTIGSASPRPQLFTFLFFAIVLYLLVEYKYFGQSKRLFLLPLMTAVWANMHAAFFAGLVLLVLFTASEWVLHYFSSRDQRKDVRALRRLSGFVLASILVTALNPQFFKLWLYPFHVISLDTAMGFIHEWQSPNFHLSLFKMYLATIILFVLCAIYAQRKPDLTEMAIPFFFLVSGLTASRHLPLTCFTLLAFTCVFLRENKWLLQHHMNHAAQAASKNHHDRRIDRLLPALNLALLVLFGSIMIRSDMRGKEQNMVDAVLPVKAADFIVSHEIKGRMFNNYGDGGYLIYRLGPQQKVFIDGRADIYGDKFLNEYLDIYYGAAGWKEKFDRFSIDYVICHMNAPIRQLLLLEGSFTEAYSDSRHSVLLRTGPKYQQVLAALGK